MVDSGNGSGTRCTDPWVGQSCRALVGRSIAGEIGDVADSRIIALQAVCRSVEVGHAVFGHIGTDGDDIGDGGLVAHAHIVGAVSKVGVGTSPDVYVGTTTRRINVNAQVVATLHSEAAGIKQYFGFVAAQVVFVSHKRTATHVGTAQRHRSPTGGRCHTDRCLHVAVAVHHVYLAAKAAHAG